MTLSSRHRIRNSSPGGLRPSTLPLGHGGSPQYWLSHVDGEETFLFLWNRRDRDGRPRKCLHIINEPIKPAIFTFLFCTEEKWERLWLWLYMSKSSYWAGEPLKNNASHESLVNHSTLVSAFSSYRWRLLNIILSAPHGPLQRFCFPNSKIPCGQ